MNKRGFTLIEVIVVISIISILAGLAVPPIREMLNRQRARDSATAMLETIKSAQVEAQKRGDTEVVNGQLRKRKVYVAVYPADMASAGNPPNTVRAISWTDLNSDNMKTSDEFSVLQEVSLGKSTFSVPSSINKTACSNNAGTPSNTGIVNFTVNVCPPNTVSFFPAGTRCIKFNGYGFSESMNNAAAYINGNGETFAVTVGLAGITDFCRWDGNNWIKVR